MLPEEFKCLTDMQLSLILLPADTDGFRTSYLSKSSTKDIQLAMKFITNHMPNERYRFLVLKNEIERRTSL